MYHKYVFHDGKFIGDFEKMYAGEDMDNYDSWHQEDYHHFRHQISELILSQYNFNTILDIGCGKGIFTRSLKKKNNQVIGIDISETAIKKANAKYKGITFVSASVDDFLNRSDMYDLVVMMDILSYLKNWTEIIEKASKHASWIYISLYIPPNPIGFIKRFDELREEIKKYYKIEEEVFWNNDVIFIIGKLK